MFKKYIAVLILALMWGTLSAQVDRSQRPQPGPAPQINIGEYKSFKLDNGLKVFVIENHKLPRISLALAFKIDPLMEGEQAGYVDMAGQLLRTGTKTRNKQQLDQEVDNIGATINTSADMVYAAGLSKHSKTLFELMADIVLNADFKEEELEKLKKQSMSGLAFARNKSDMIAERIRNRVYYGSEHPYGQIETEASIGNISVDVCRDYYKVYMRPNRGYLAIVGDISLKQAENLTRKHFSKWEKSKVPFHQYKIPSEPDGNRVVLVDRPSAVQSAIRVGYPVKLKRGGKDHIKAAVLNQILGGSSTGRLHLNLREEKGLTYGAYSSLSPDQYIGSFTAFTEVRNSATDSAVTEILAELKRLKGESVGMDELAAAKNYLTGAFARSLEDPQTIARFALNTERYWMPKDFYKNFLKNLAAVTAEDIKKTASAYLKPENAYLLVVGNIDEVGKSMRKFSANDNLEFYDFDGNIYQPDAFKAPEGVTAESVIEKYVQAIGGRANLEKVKDLTVNAQSDFAGRKATVTIMRKAPNMLCQTVSLGRFRQKTVFDGIAGMSVASGQKIEVIGEPLERLKFEAEMNSLSKLDQLWIETSLVSESEVNGHQTYKIKLKPRTSSAWFSYFDKKTGLEVRREQHLQTPRGDFTQITDYDDYREVQGVKYPYLIEQETGPQKVSTMVISIQVNSGLKDSEFSVEF